MKNAFFISIIAVLVIIFSISFINSSFTENTKIEQISSEKEDKTIYFAKIENNIINIYTETSGNKQYFKTVNGANIYDLPEEEYNSLLKGKYFYSPEEVASFIEVITSWFCTYNPVYHLINPLVL